MAVLETVITADNKQFIRSTLEARQKVKDLANTISKEYGTSLREAQNVARQTLNNTQKQLYQTQRAAQSAGGAFKDMFKILAGTVTITALVSTFTRVADSIDKIGYTAAKLNLPTEQFQEFEYVAKKADTSIETVEAGFKRLRVSIGEGLAGNSKVNSFFDKLGLSAKSLSTLSIGDAYKKIAEATNKISSSQGQSDVVGGLFGKKAGQEQLNFIHALTAGTKEYKELDIGLTKEQLAIYELYDAQMDKTSALIDDKLKKAVITLIPTILALGNAFAFVVEKSGNALGTISNGLSEGATEARRLLTGASEYNPNSNVNARYTKNSDGFITVNRSQASIDQSIRNRVIARSSPIASASAGNSLGVTAGSIPTVVQAATQLANTFKNLSIAGDATASALKNSSEGRLNKLLGIKPASGQEYLNSVLSPAEEVKTERFTRLATQLRDNIASKSQGFGLNNNSLVQALLSEANSNGGIEGKSNAGQLAAAKDLANIVNGVNQGSVKSPEVIIKFSVDKSGIINAFAQSSAGVKLIKEAAASFIADEAAQTGF